MRHVIIGSGPAGVVAAETLRKADPAAEIFMLCGEGEAPYSRMAIPYLLRGDIGEEGTHLRKTADHFQRLRIGLVQARAHAVNTAARTIHQAHMVLDQLQRAQLGQGGGVLGRAGRGGPGGEEGYGLRDGGASVRECAHA